MKGPNKIQRRVAPVISDNSTVRKLISIDPIHIVDKIVLAIGFPPINEICK